MECQLCGITDQEADIFQGIYSGEITEICGECAKEEKIPLIRKPTSDQLSLADREYSVRERMEKIFKSNKEYIGKDHEVAMKNLAKIKVPPKSQQPENLVENYHWEIKIARRRKKLPISQLSKESGIPLEILKELERGQLPKNYEPFLLILEELLDIRIFKEHERRMILHIPEKTSRQREKEIIEQTREKLIETEKQQKSKQKAIKEISTGDFDFSKKENIEKITLSDLIELKKQREKIKNQHKEQKEHKEMFGDELELDIDED